LATTLAAWLAAFLLVLALLSILGDELSSLPLAVRALAISGVQVTIMTTAVMPALNVAVGRWLAGSTRERSESRTRDRSAMSAVPEPGNDRVPPGRPTRGLPFTDARDKGSHTRR
jgi:hypothetical protein